MEKLRPGHYIDVAAGTPGGLPFGVTVAVIVPRGAPADAVAAQVATLQKHGCTVEVIETDDVEAETRKLQARTDADVRAISAAKLPPDDDALERADRDRRRRELARANRQRQAQHAQRGRGR